MSEGIQILKRILIDACNIRSGGGVTHLHSILKTANPSKFEVGEVIVLTSKKTADLLPKKNWLTIKSPFWCGNNTLIRLIGQQLLVPYFARKNKCHAIFYPGGIVSLLSGLPKITMSQNMLPFEEERAALFGKGSWMHLKMTLLRIIQGYSFTRANGVIFLTNYAETVIRKALGNRIRLTAQIAHGVEKRFFCHPKNRIISVKKSKNPFRILYVSSIFPYKHQLEVIHAIADLRGSGLNVELSLVGQGNNSYEQRVRTKIRQLDPKGDYLFFLGGIAFDEIHHCYMKSDAFVFASSCENLPNILIEAMASGMPIICSSLGPMPEVLGEQGLYFDPFKPETLKSGIKKIYFDSDLCNKLSQDAFEKSKSYSWETCSHKTFSFLSTIVDQQIKSL